MIKLGDPSTDVQGSDRPVVLETGEGDRPGRQGEGAARVLPTAWILIGDRSAPVKLGAGGVRGHGEVVAASGKGGVSDVANLLADRSDGGATQAYKTGAALVVDANVQVVGLETDVDADGGDGDGGENGEGEEDGLVVGGPVGASNAEHRV